MTNHNKSKKIIYESKEYEKYDHIIFECKNDNDVVRMQEIALKFGFFYPVYYNDNDKSMNIKFHSIEEVNHIILSPNYQMKKVGEDFKVINILRVTETKNNINLYKLKNILGDDKKYFISDKVSDIVGDTKRN